MSKTYRRLPRFYFRQPRGHRQAIINEVRRKAIPPSAWDDKPCSDEAWLPWRIIRILKEKGVSPELARKKMIRKFHLKSWEINEMIRRVY